ncbi:MAG: flagellar assembly protein FliW [Lachnospiraceae bacterium]|nr:flagellar assembly protein FliW [Lachnospiraceae bacterium]
MKANTKYFGMVDIDEEKVLTFDGGLIGLEEYKKFAVINDIEDENATISWLQSLEEPEFALPIIDPLLIKGDYDPVVEDEWLKSLGEAKGEDYFVLVTLTVPEDLEKMTANLKAPIVINMNTRKGAQIIVENQDYSVRYPIYEILKAAKEKAGE